MGSNASKLNVDVESSEVGTLNWDKSEENNGLQEIDLKIKPLSESENSISQLSEVFQKMQKEISSEEMKLDDSSPFISTELYKRIIGGNNSSDPQSPLISTSSFINKFNLEGGGGHSLSSSSSSSSSFSDSEESTSSSEILKALSEISVSSSDYPDIKKKEYKSYDNDNKSKYHSSSSSPPLKGYNFSETSSMMSNYKGGNTSETSYKLDSDSIRTSDINLVSVDSVNGRRFLN